jgi:hypothetical protein
MFVPTRIVVYSLIIGFLTPLQAGPAEDLVTLTEGVESLQHKGTAGGISVQSRTGFAVVMTPKNEVIVGAGYTGDVATGGRVVAMSHTGLLRAGGNRWTANLAAWAGRKKDPSVALVGLGDREWAGAPGRLISVKGAVTAASLRGVDLVVANLHGNGFVEAASALEAFARAGGGIVLVATPWAASAPARAAAARLMGPAGLAFAGGGPNDGTIPVLKTLSVHANAVAAGEALENERRGGVKLSQQEREQCCGTLEACLAGGEVSAALKGVLDGMHAARGWVEVDLEHILRKKVRPLDAVIARYQHWLMQRMPAEATLAHPSAKDYPGAVGNGSAVTKVVDVEARTGPDRLINHGYRTRVGTGVYAKPGVPVRVRVPDAAVGSGLKVEIGIHVDANWNLGTWRRFPEISKSVELTGSETVVANAFGGLVSILVPADCALGRVRVEVSGGVEAPVFVLGRTSEAEWHSRVKQSPGAWGYIETPKWTGYFSAEELRRMEHPEEVGKYWQSVVETADRVLGYGKWRRRGESMLVDRDIYVGYGHAGYPVMMAYGAEAEANRTALSGRGPVQGDWGFLHELGHTFQDSFDGNYTIATHGEVDVNLVPGLVINLVHGRTSWDNDSHGTFDAKTRLRDWERWNALPEGERTWAKACSMNVGYDFYFTLAECFGWGLYEKAFTRWMDWLQRPGADAGLDAIDGKGPNARRDRFFLLFCEAAGRNLLPYFRKYGLGSGDAGISPSVIASVKKLPEWAGNQPIEALAGPSVVRCGAARKGDVVATFAARDPDAGTVFSYRIVSGDDGGAFGLDRRTGRMVLREPSALTFPSRLIIEVQDNCIPLSTRRMECEVMR